MSGFFDLEAARKHCRTRKYVRALEVERDLNLADKSLHFESVGSLACKLCGSDLALETQKRFAGASGNQKVKRADLTDNEISQGEQHIALSFDASVAAVCHECLQGESSAEQYGDGFARGPVRDAGAHYEIPAVQPAGDDAGRGGSSSPRSVRRLISDGWERLGDSLLGDLIGGVCLAIITAAIIFAGVLG